MGLITSTEALWSSTAALTKERLERRGIKVIFRSLEPYVAATDEVSIRMGSDYFGPNSNS